MRILVCNWKDRHHPAAGGAEVYTWQVVRRWAAQGHEVSWFAAEVPDRPRQEVDEGVRVFRGGSRLGVYRAARQFAEAQGPGSFDLVVDEVNTRPFGTPGWRDPSGKPFPVVALVHQLAKEVWHAELPWPLASLGRWWLEPRWYRPYRDIPVLTISPSSEQSLRDIGLRDVTQVGQGVATPLRQPGAPRAEVPTLLFVGRLCGSKRPDHTLHAFALLRESLPEARLWMVGDGPLRPRLQARAPKGVQFFGRVDEATKHRLMSEAHALVLTSVREGWGLVVDEAAALGTPTVAYDRPGLCDSVPAARGVLTSPTPRALAEVLCDRLPAWYQRPAERGWRGGAASWDDVADEVLTVARAGLARRAAPVGAAPRGTLREVSGT